MNENKDFQIPERMLLQKEVVAAERIGAGLINRGNTCFVNSILQCLTHTSPLVNYFKITDHAGTCQPTGFCMLCELQTHITNSYAKSGSAIVPESILQNIKLIARHMTLGRQEDAHEFLIYTLNAMRRSCSSGINGWDQFNETKNTAVDQIFGGVLRSQVKCVQCRGESDTFQPSMDINLEIKNVRTLEEAFSNYFQLESLGEDAYSCAKCDKKVQAVKGMAIEKAPNVLTVSLQRFDYMFGKVGHQVRFPETLDIRPYMSITQGDAVMYELYAVVVHSGHSYNSGHYYSYAKSALGNWYHMNDSKVKPVPVLKVLSSQAYLLFYKKCETSHTQKNKSDTNTTDSLANGATGEPNIVGSLLSPTTSSQGTPNRPVNARNDDKTSNLKENHATVKNKRSWSKAFTEEFDHRKMNACSTNDEDTLPTRGTTTAPARKKQGDEKSRIQNYVEEVIPHYTDVDFRRMFRMNPSTFTSLMNYLQDLPEMQPAGPGRRKPIPMKKQILLTLWYLGGVDIVTKIADRFGISESSVVLCRDRVLSAFVNLRHKLIVWPNPQEMREEATEFSRRNGFPGTVGAIDGTHIKIRAPSLHPQSYVNRKGFHSIQLQCVCLHNMLFSDVFTGYPGSCHDTRVLKNSDLWSEGLTRCNMVHHILGDGAYPLRKWLLTPYRDNGHLTPQEKKYNYYHSSNRVVIERAFALLKSRFRRLYHIDTTQVPTAVDIIMASCVIHNICIKENDNIDEYLAQDEPDDGAHLNVNLIQDHNAEGVVKRNTITRNLH